MHYEFELLLHCHIYLIFLGAFTSLSLKTVENIIFCIDLASISHN